MISFDQFADVELKVAEIKECTCVDKSDKLLRFVVNVGEDEDRVIFSGIQKHYDPSSLINKKCIVVSNLEPRKMMGEESQGMIVCVSYENNDEEVVRMVEPPEGTPIGIILS